MNKDNLGKAVVLSVVLLFIVVGVYPAVAIKIDITKSITLVNDGTLSGYVNDTSGNPIKGALITVHFHETYEEAYSDDYGYYFVDNIPICWCYKNATCSKEGYKSEWVLLAIYENTKYDFVLTSSPYGVDLSCDEPYQNVKQGNTAIFIVEITNTGDINDTYDVIAGSIEDIICKVNGVNADQFNPYEFTLSSDESTTFRVTVEVWESVPVGEWSIIIEARSQNDSEIYKEFILTVNIQKKIKPIISPFNIDVYYDCEIETSGPIWGIALLFPGYFRSLKPDAIPTVEADGILLCGIFNTEHDYLTVDNNTYLQNDWTIMIVSNFTGLMDNWGKLQNRFFISGFASRVVIYDLNPFNY